MISLSDNNCPHKSKSLSCCPICGSNVIVDELFCDKCGMRIHNHQYHKYVVKANLRSRYIFYFERDYEDVKAAIYNANSTIYYKLDWYGDWGYVNGHDHAWRVDLYDNLTQEELECVVGYIREHNGQYYKD